MRQLLVCFHEGFLLLDRLYPIYVELISSNAGLLHSGIDLVPYLCTKRDVTKMKEKYDLQHKNRGFPISSIIDNKVRFTMKILSCKLLCKMRCIECTIGIVELAEQCVEGVTINWSQFLLKELLDDAAQV